MRGGPPHRSQQQVRGGARGFTDIVPGKAAALEICTDGRGLTLTNVHRPQAGCSPWAGRAAF